MAKKKISLSKVEEVYVRDQMDKVPPEEIAADLKVPAARVRTAVKRIRAERDEKGEAPAEPPRGMGSPAMRRLAAHPSGAVVMTPDQSMTDDARLGASPFESHPVPEAARAYVRQHKDELSPEDLARDTGLPPHVVRQLLDAINSPQQGREAWLARNRNTVHKINPGLPVR